MAEMSYQKLNDDWNAEPNAPEPILTIDYNKVYLEFFLNHFVHEQFEENQKGALAFRNVHKLSFNSMNDEGYYMGQYRYSYDELPWGDFYQINTDWTKDFPENNVLVLGPNASNEKLKHYIFFLRDNTFECVAESFEFKIQPTQTKTS